MHDRKVAIIKNKKCYMSSDYVRNIINTYRGRNDNINSDFFRIGLPQSIDVSKEHPVTLYDKFSKPDFNMENEIKKELADNYGILNNTALKYNLLKFYSLNTSSINLKKNKNNKKYIRNKLYINSNALKPFESENRQLRISYSEKIRRKKYKSHLLKNNNTNLLNNNSFQKKESNDNKLYKNKLTEKEYIEKFIGDRKNRKNNNTNNLKRLRKKEFLDNFNISYENVDIKENEKNIEKKKTRKVKIFKNGKYINKPKIIEKPKFVIKKEKKLIKNKIDVNSFEYINKIKSEIDNKKNENDK